MECHLKCEKPGEIVYTMTVTMTADEWQRLRDQLRDGKNSYLFPAQGLVSHIEDLLGQTKKVYWPSVAISNGARESEAT